MTLGLAIVIGVSLVCGANCTPAEPAQAAPETDGHATPLPAAAEPARATIPVPTPAPAERPQNGTVEPDARFRCVMPALPIPRPRACARGAPYPNCKWKIPHALHSQHTWRRWRNTISAHQYGRPALVALLVTVAREMHRLAPEQPFVIGDLDAPGPRHSTHDHGVDADLYLPGTLMVENAGGGDYVDNYAGLSPEEREAKRATVLMLAQVLATCSGGQIRIYYNDALVRERFLRWFEERGYVSSFGAPMQGHNHLHDFHFHISVPEDLPLLESESYAEPPPVEPIEAPPTAAETAASNALSSRSTREMRGSGSDDDTPDPTNDVEDPPLAPNQAQPNQAQPSRTEPLAPAPAPSPMRPLRPLRPPTPAPEMPRWPTQPAR